MNETKDFFLNHILHGVWVDDNRVNGCIINLNKMAKFRERRTKRKRRRNTNKVVRAKIEKLMTQMSKMSTHLRCELR